MSKFIDAVRARLIPGHDRPVLPPISALEVTSEMYYPTPSYDHTRRYRIGVDVGWHLELRQEDVPLAMDNVIRELRDLVYGEFRDRLIRLERAIYEYKLDDAKAELRDIHREISGY